MESQNVQAVSQLSQRFDIPQPFHLLQQTHLQQPLIPPTLLNQHQLPHNPTPQLPLIPSQTSLQPPTATQQQQQQQQQPSLQPPIQHHNQTVSQQQAGVYNQNQAKNAVLPFDPLSSMYQNRMRGHLHQHMHLQQSTPPPAPSQQPQHRRNFPVPPSHFNDSHQVMMYALPPPPHQRNVWPPYFSDPIIGGAFPKGQPIYHAEQPHIPSSNSASSNSAMPLLQSSNGSSVHFVSPPSISSSLQQASSVTAIAYPGPAMQTELQQRFQLSLQDPPFPPPHAHHHIPHRIPLPHPLSLQIPPHSHHPHSHTHLHQLQLQQQQQQQQQQQHQHQHQQQHQQQHQHQHQHQQQSLHHHIAQASTQMQPPGSLNAQQQLQQLQNMNQIQSPSVLKSQPQLGLGMSLQQAQSQTLAQVPNVSQSVLHSAQVQNQNMQNQNQANVNLSLAWSGNNGTEAPIFVNPKQFHRILKRRMAKAKQEAMFRIERSKKPFLHDSRHRHAMKRKRGPHGRFITLSETSNDNEGKSALEDKAIDSENMDRSSGNIPLCTQNNMQRIERNPYCEISDGNSSNDGRSVEVNAQLEYTNSDSNYENGYLNNDADISDENHHHRDAEGAAEPMPIDSQLTNLTTNQHQAENYHYESPDRADIASVRESNDAMIVDTREYMDMDSSNQYMQINCMESEDTDVKKEITADDNSNSDNHNPYGNNNINHQNYSNEHDRTIFESDPALHEATLDMEGESYKKRLTNSQNITLIPSSSASIDVISNHTGSPMANGSPQDSSIMQNSPHHQMSGSTSRYTNAPGSTHSSCFGSNFVPISSSTIVTSSGNMATSLHNNPNSPSGHPLSTTLPQAVTLHTISPHALNGVQVLPHNVAIANSQGISNSVGILMHGNQHVASMPNPSHVAQQTPANTTNHGNSVLKSPGIPLYISSTAPSSYPPPPHVSLGRFSSGSPSSSSDTSNSPPPPPPSSIHHQP